MLTRGTVVLFTALTFICAIAVMAQSPARPPQPSAEHKKLGVFVGTWRDDVELKPGPLGPGGKFSMMETCEWFDGGFSVVCHSEVTGVMNQKALTVLTYDPEEKLYAIHEFNSLGVSRSAKGTVDADTWSWKGESKMGGKLIKSHEVIDMASPDSATMTAEMSVDGGPWTSVMELKGKRVN